MKILYIATDQNNPPNEPLVDYQNDCLLIGLKELFGEDVVDYKKRYHIYKDFSQDEAKKQYGKGFTLTRVLDPDNTDRSDIVKKIEKKYFDLVVYGSIWRCQDLLDVVLEHYPKNKIVLIDGDDQTKFHHTVKHGVPYFKRELVWEHNWDYKDYFGNVNSIGFAFPGSKAIGPAEKKTQLYGTNDPRSAKSYVFDDENAYYEDYSKSKYAFTCPKAGWDCLRHYEIMASGCIPLFENLPMCPRFICTRFPKALATKIGFFYKFDFKYLESQYDYFLEEITKHFWEYNTTQALGKYILDELSIFDRFNQKK